MKNSKSSLFLMELVIVILFFSLSSAVCIQLFVKAHQLDQDTVNINHSMIWIQNLAETYRAYEGDMDKVSEFYKDQNTEVSESIVLLFDEDWQATDKIEAAAFRVELAAYSDSAKSEVLRHGEMKECEIIVTDLAAETEPIAKQKISYYLPNQFVQEVNHE